MPATLITRTAASASAARPEVPVGKRTPEVVSHDSRVTHPQADRVHMSNVVLGLIDAHFSGVDFLDTPGGEELWRWYEARRASHREAKEHDTSAAKRLSPR